VFAALALLVVVISLRLPREEVRVAPPWATVAGILMVMFGLVYPHFLETSTFVTYLYAAPVGLIPCPTLSLVIGLALVADGLGARTLPLVLGFSGIFYGATGVLQLGVSLDWVLLVGSLVIVIVAMRRTKAAEASAVPPAPQTGRPGSPA